jgi:hypothetical protein
MSDEQSGRSDPWSAVVIALTLLLFLVSIFVKGFTHELLLEAGVLMVSIKLIPDGPQEQPGCQPYQPAPRSYRRIAGNASRPASARVKMISDLERQTFRCRFPVSIASRLVSKRCRIGGARN